MGYAASFCMKRAIAVYLSLSSKDKVRGMIGLNDVEHQCQLTGFHPIHAVVANGYEGMYDFLADLPGLGALVGGDSLKAREDVPNGQGMLDACAAECASCTARTLRVCGTAKPVRASASQCL